MNSRNKKWSLPSMDRKRSEGQNVPKACDSLALRFHLGKIYTLKCGFGPFVSVVDDFTQLYYYIGVHKEAL